MLKEFKHVTFKPLNIIRVLTDDSCDMHEVWINDDLIYMGNTWDFHNGCHGSKLPTFRSVEGYVDRVAAHLKANDLQHVIVRGKYECQE